jgi:hypothetical protein
LINIFILKNININLKKNFSELFIILNVFLIFIGNWLRFSVIMSLYLVIILTYFLIRKKFTTYFFENKKQLKYYEVHSSFEEFEVLKKEHGKIYILLKNINFKDIKLLKKAYILDYSIIKNFILLDMDNNIMNILSKFDIFKRNVDVLDDNMEVICSMNNSFWFKIKNKYLYLLKYYSI